MESSAERDASGRRAWNAGLRYCTGIENGVLCGLPQTWCAVSRACVGALYCHGIESGVLVGYHRQRVRWFRCAHGVVSRVPPGFDLEYCRGFGSGFGP